MKCRGFTLVEMMITVVVASVVLTLGVPSFRSLIQSNRIAAQSNDLMTALHLARSEAVKRGLSVSVCASADGQTCSSVVDWSTGWIVFTDASGVAGVVDGSDAVLRSWGALTGDATLSCTGAFLQYRALGTVAGSAGFDLSIADAGPSGATRYICIAGPGRPLLATSPC